MGDGHLIEVACCAGPDSGFVGLGSTCGAGPNQGGHVEDKDNIITCNF